MDMEMKGLESNWYQMEWDVNKQKHLKVAKKEEWNVEELDTKLTKVDQNGLKQIDIDYMPYPYFFFLAIQ